MLSDKIISMTEDQIKKEFESAYLYLEIASFYEENGLSGFAGWFLAQAKEEEEHAMRFYTFLHDNQASISFFPIEPPKAKYTDFSKPLFDSYEHEKFITNSINSIYTQAINEKDYRTQEFLDWFIEEQQEEEANAQKLVEKYHLFGKTADGLYELNKEFGKRD